MPISRSPAFIQPMTAVNVAVLPEGDQWFYEVTLDGYRALLLKHGGHVQIRSRKNNDLTATYPSVVATALKVNADSAVLDGEIVALDQQGRPSFQVLHRAVLQQARHGRARIEEGKQVAHWTRRPSIATVLHHLPAWSPQCPEGRSPVRVRGSVQLPRWLSCSWQCVSSLSGKYLGPTGIVPSGSS